MLKYLEPARKVLPIKRFPTRRVTWSNNVFHRRFRKEFENNMQVSTEPVILTSQIGIWVICDFFDYSRRLRVANTTVKNQSPDTAKSDQHSP